MSAFICSPEHIFTLANALSTQRFSKHDLKESAKILALANIESIKARYPRSSGNEANFFFPDIKANEEYIKLCQAYQPAPTKTPVEIVKLAHCFEYQSCEYKGWETSQAKKLIESIISSAICQVPGYEVAEWSI